MESNDTFLLFRLWFLAVTVLIAVNLVLVSFNLSRAEAISLSPRQAYHKIAGKSHLPAPDVKGFAAGVADSVVSVARVPAQIAGAMTRPGSLTAVIRPSETDKTPVPVITGDSDPAGSDTKAAGQTVSTVGYRPQWPIHGVITTGFGVSEWPYERVHTGLDISDGKSPGITPVQPFRPGVVTAVIYGGGLGNHVVVDHGGGVSSVYGHMNSVAVRSGQTVNQATVLGYEGSTGVSTGTHLHFEIRVRGQPQDPRKFIRGQP